MKTLAGVLFVCALIAFQSAQEKQVRASWAACTDIEVWSTQEYVRHESPAEWAGFMRGLVLENACRIMRDSAWVLVVGQDSTVHAVQVLLSDDTLWWLSVEAVRP